MRRKMARLQEISLLARFQKYFFSQCMRMSFREWWFLRLYQDGVINYEVQTELDWAKSRKLSLARLSALRPAEEGAEETTEESMAAARLALEELVGHYSPERVSAAQDSSEGCMCARPTVLGSLRHVSSEFLKCSVAAWQADRVQDMLDLHPGQPFVESLNVFELENLKAYRKICPDAAVQLNQSARGQGHRCLSFVWLRSCVACALLRAVMPKILKFLLNSASCCQLCQCNFAWMLTT